MSIGVLHGQNGGGKGAALTVTAPAGSTVTATKDGKTMTRVAGADRIVVFRGLETGTWTLSITDGTQTAGKTVDIVADYATTIGFFAATINITYPAGSVCTATDGVTTLTAPDTSGTWACVVPNAGNWTLSIGNGLKESVEVVVSGENYIVDKWHIYNKGDECGEATGGWTLTGNNNYAAKETDCLYVYSPVDNGSYNGEIRTVNKIDLTNIKTITLNNVVKVGVDNGFCAVTTSENIYNGFTARTKLTNPTCVLDVSALTGAYYIFVMGNTGGGGSRISEIVMQ